MLFGLRETTEPLRVVAIFAGFKYGHVTVRYSPQRDLWAMPRHRMAPPGGLSVLPGPVLAGGESSEWATRITLIPRFQTPHEPSQPQSQNRTLRNGSASDRKGPTPRKDEHTGNNTVVNAIPRTVHRKCVTREPFPFKVGYSHKQMTLDLVSSISQLALQASEGQNFEDKIAHELPAMKDEMMGRGRSYKTRAAHQMLDGKAQSRQ